jgi:regulator of replication initiation timing
MSYDQGSKTVETDASSENGRVPFSEATAILRTEPHLLWRWSQRFALFLGPDVTGDHPHYTTVDIQTLEEIQSLQAEGLNDQQIAQHLALHQAAAEERASSASAASALAELENSSEVPNLPAKLLDGGEMGTQALHDVFNALASGQQAVLNNQTSMREIVGVVVQDNFNLKGENRKLRERMLELERTLAEYQRREETRKERLESRLRALEGTVGGLQHQIAQIVQLLRKRRRRFFW